MRRRDTLLGLLSHAALKPWRVYLIALHPFYRDLIAHSFPRSLVFHNGNIDVETRQEGCRVAIARQQSHVFFFFLFFLFFLFFSFLFFSFFFFFFDPINAVGRVGRNTAKYTNWCWWKEITEIVVSAFTRTVVHGSSWKNTSLKEKRAKWTESSIWRYSMWSPKKKNLWTIFSFF